MSTKKEPDTVDIAQAMIRFGGSFMQCIGQVSPVCQGITGKVTLWN